MAKPRLRVHILLNKGKKGISLHRLPKMLADIQKFLDSLSEDTVGRSPDWTGLHFRSTASVEYTAESAEVIDLDRVKDFDECLKGVVRSKPDPKIRRSTLLQYARIAEPFGEETVSFGIGSDLDLETSRPDVRLEWFDFNKAEAANLAATGQALIKSHGGFQGVVHSLFLGSSPPHFQLRELSTGDLIRCEYDDSRYQEIIEALEKPRAVIHVYGVILTDLVNRRIQRVQVSRLDVARYLTLADLDRFIGCAPELFGPGELQHFVDESRGRG
jgi:hypothetical protein